MRNFEQYTDRIARLYPPERAYDDNGDKILSQCVTLQVTDDCNLSCSYCYQIHKGKRRMSLETAKKFIDLVISGEKGFSEYINPEKSPGLVIDFIGGEPFLEIELIDQMCTYIMDQLIEKQHPWAMKTMFSICSNGILYFDPKVQDFLNKWANRLSFSVTIDGNKELHDSCRVFPDGRPSYDLAVAAAKDWIGRGNYMGSKITIAPENIMHLYNAIVHMVELGYTEINANCVYEKGWKPIHATVLYEEMKRISDYFLERDFDFERDFFCSLYQENFFHPKHEEDLQNWCFKAGTKILTPYGNVNIEDLKPGDKVISGSGNIRTIERNMTRLSTDTRILKIAGMEPIYTTSEHPILTKRFLYRGNKGVKRFSEPIWVNASDLRKHDKIAVFKPKFGKVHVDEKLAYIVGRYIGDGWHSTTGYKICSSYSEAEILSSKLSEAKINFSTSDYRTVKQFNIFKNNVELLSILSDAGTYAHGKKIPGVVFSWDKSSVLSLLNGLFDADGSYDAKNQRQKFNTVSPVLAQDVLHLLRGLGYYPMCYLNKRAGTQMIENRIVNVRDRYEIYFYLNSQRSARCNYDETNDVIWTTVYSSEQADSYTVYNLSVEEDHTYIANGVVVHNCGGNGVMLACDPDGVLFPCLRYMESSLGNDQEPYSIGDIETGIAQTPCDQCRVECLKKIDRRTQSTDECFYCPIGEGCSWCFKAGTLITTPDGFKPIEDIEVGDNLISGDGNIQKVENISKRFTDDTLYLKATGMLPIYTTTEHPFLVRKFRRSGSNLIYGDPEWIKACDIKKSDKIALYVNKFGDVNVDKNIAYLAGRYLGDGWKTTTTRGNCESTKYLMCCSYEESSVLENYFNSAKISVYKDKSNRTAQEYNIHSTNHSADNNNERLISIISECGKYAHGKYVPQEVFTWNKESIEYFLKGYFDADGHHDKKRETLKFITVSLSLAQGISSLLLMFGKKCNWCVRKSTNNIIDGRQVNTHTTYELSFLVREPIRKYFEFDSKNNIMWVNVSEVSTNVEGYDVYNMSVENDHTYIANGAIVHNCTAYNYQVFGTPDARATYICNMHKARALGNLYFWNKYYRKHNIHKRMENHVPDDWALEIITQDELSLLKDLAKEDYES